MSNKCPLPIRKPPFLSHFFKLVGTQGKLVSVTTLYTTNTQEMSEIRVLSKIDRTALTKTLSQACALVQGNTVTKVRLK